MTMQQAIELLREVANVSPAVYEQQQQADAAGVRIVASFIAELADRYNASQCFECPVCKVSVRKAGIQTVTQSAVATAHNSCYS